LFFSIAINDILNPSLFTPETIATNKQTFHEYKPFPTLKFSNFCDSTFLTRIRDELTKIDYYNKSNDLFEFMQSSDLKSCTKPLITKLRDILYGETFRNMLQSITGIEITGLNHDVDMSANVYDDTNTLLCHDDELLGRRIAYIL
jgi:hypothetical protein